MVKSFRFSPFRSSDFLRRVNSGDGVRLSGSWTPEVVVVLVEPSVLSHFLRTVAYTGKAESDCDDGLFVVGDRLLPLGIVGSLSRLLKRI